MGFVVNYPPVTNVTVDETTNEVVVAAAGPRGPQGDPGVVAATAPLTYDSGTQTIALDESGIEIAPSQVTGTAVVDNDSRLSDARTPTAHATSHEAGGSDELTLAQSQVTGLVTDLSNKAPTTALYLSGTAGNYVSAPDSAALDITGDIDIRVKVAMDDWNSPATNPTLVSKYFEFANRRSWIFTLLNNGRLQLLWRKGDDTGNIFATSTVSTGISADSVKWVRVTLDVDDGGVYKVNFYLSDDGITWAQLGTTVVGASTTSIRSSNESTLVGAYSLGANNPLTGKVHRAIVKDGIDGTTVADWRGDVPAVRYRDEYGNNWTVNGTANAWVIV